MTGRSLFQDLALLAERGEPLPPIAIDDYLGQRQLARRADRIRREDREAEQAEANDRLRRFAAGEAL